MKWSGTDKGGEQIPLDLSWIGHDSGRIVPHISVCVCSYRQPRQLGRLLLKLNEQVTEGLFTFSIIVADNDPERSASAAVAMMGSQCKVPIRYCVEPRRSMAMARNKAVEHAEGAFIALIDEDEFPDPIWLLTLYLNLCEYRVDGVLGLVKRHFEEVPPAWFRKSTIYTRPMMPTGTELKWKESCTGNALLKRGMLACDPAPFRPEFRAGEDQDFFRRKIEAGYRFIWSAEAVVCETIPPARWKRTSILRKSLLQGANAALQPNCTKLDIAMSAIAVMVFMVLLPFTLLLSQQRFMRMLVKICGHSGKVLRSAGINPVREGCDSE